jgi:hypothetical protein
VVRIFSIRINNATFTSPYIMDNFGITNLNNAFALSN